MIKGSKIFKVTVSGGKVDPKPFNKYKDWEKAIEDNDFAEVTEEIHPYKEKAKANYRWMIMSQNLQKGLDTLSNIDCEATSSTIPDSVEFILTYTQPDGLYIDVDESEYDPDNKEIIKSNDRVLFLGTKAIKRIIEDTLNKDYEVILTYFSPESYDGSKKYESPLAKGTVMEKLPVEAVSPSVDVEELVDGYREFAEEVNLDEE